MQYLLYMLQIKIYKFVVYFYVLYLLSNIYWALLYFVLDVGDVMTSKMWCSFSSTSLPSEELDIRKMKKVWIINAEKKYILMNFLTLPILNNCLFWNPLCGFQGAAQSVSTFPVHVTFFLSTAWTMLWVIMASVLVFMTWILPSLLSPYTNLAHPSRPALLHELLPLWTYYCNSDTVFTACPLPSWSFP